MININKKVDYAKGQLIKMNKISDKDSLMYIDRDCVLVEKRNEKSYSYDLYNYINGKKKHLTRRSKQIQESSLRDLIFIVRNKSIPIYNISYPKDPIELIKYIFTNIFPQYGYVKREDQIDLCINMYKAMKSRKILLSDVAVGFGKTHAYIVAAILFNLSTKEDNRPIIISTSSKALQNSIASEYIPEISNILLENGIISKPVTSVLRKGKDNYLCKKRLRYYFGTLDKNKKNPKEYLLLKNMLHTSKIDLSSFPTLIPYDKERINVKTALCNQCNLISECKYKKYMQDVLSYKYDFQISNHNYYLADITTPGKRLFPQAKAVIYDEAHKLSDVATSTHTTTISEDELNRLFNQLIPKNINSSINRSIAELIKDARILSDQIFNDAKKFIPDNFKDEDVTLFSIDINKSRKNYNRLHNKLNEITQSIGSVNTLTRASLRNHIRMLSEFKKGNMIYWVNKSDSLTLNCVPQNVGRLLSNNALITNIPIIMTSGTIAINNDFSYFKSGLGLNSIPNGKITEISKKSTFNYYDNTLIYIAKDMPYPDYNNEDYTKIITDQIQKLIQTSHGHALVLFTSYTQLNQVFRIVKNNITKYPLFKTVKGDVTSIDKFRKSSNGVLFGCGPVWEGINIPGDILSHLIIVKLPFSVPNPINEFKQKAMGEFLYKKNILIPQMLIKLRQGHGRAVRRETDTAVISILDSRASTYYKSAIISSLPKSKITNKLSDVEQFFIDKKPDNYFNATLVKETISTSYFDIPYK